MAFSVYSIPETSVTKPAYLVGKPNGYLPTSDLRSFTSSTSLRLKLLVPVSYAMQAMHIAAYRDGIDLESTGRYRPYSEQVSTFLNRYTTTYLAGRPSKYWNGRRYYLKPGYAPSATPGTSNHGLGLADDIAQESDGDTGLESISRATLQWLSVHARSFGFGLETHGEPWHWHWIGRNALPQRVVDTLHGAGVKIPDLWTKYRFTVPKPSVSSPTDPDVLPTPPGYPSMSRAKGSTDANTVVTDWPGGRVSVLQKIIGVKADGIYGDATHAKVVELQRIGGITADGIYGNQTMTKFLEWRGI